MRAAFILYPVNHSPIGIFDSGCGGLTVLKACRKILPREDFLYFGDRGCAPYGTRSPDYIIGRSFTCVNRFVQSGCKAVVVACNTATNAAIDRLRESFPQPIIGVEPALKPAAETDEFKTIVILCTPATAQSEKFQNLYQKYGSSRIMISPQSDLARLIEENLVRLDKIRPQVYEILQSLKLADAVVLGCTHYHFIEPMILDFYAAQNRPVKIFESATGTAKRLKEALTEKKLLSGRLKGTVRITIA